MKTAMAILFFACSVLVSAIPYDRDLDGAVALTGVASGAAAQVFSEAATGGDAEVVSLNGVSTAVEQEGDVLQVAYIGYSGPDTEINTLQAISGSNEVVATDSLIADISADESILVQNAAATVVQGAGTIVAGGTAFAELGKKN